jgi:hypothetical protein
VSIHANLVLAGGCENTKIPLRIGVRSSDDCAARIAKLYLSTGEWSRVGFASDRWPWPGWRHGHDARHARLRCACFSRNACKQTARNSSERKNPMTSRQVQREILSDEWCIS